MKSLDNLSLYVETGAKSGETSDAYKSDFHVASAKTEMGQTRAGAERGPKATRFSFEVKKGLSYEVPLSKNVGFFARDLIKGGSHKYIRKYRRGNSWVYVYHEAGQHGRQIHEDAVNHIKELAELGDHHAKALHDTIEPHDEKKLELLRKLADAGDEAAHHHLKTLGIDRHSERTEEALVPKLARQPKDPIHKPFGEKSPAALNEVRDALKEKIFGHLAGHTSSPYAHSLATRGITLESIMAKLDATSPHSLLTSLHKALKDMDAAHSGLPESANSTARAAGGYANLGYDSAVKALEKEGMLPEGYSAEHKREKDNPDFKPIKAGELTERAEKRKREAEEAAARQAESDRREMGEYADKVAEMTSYFGRSLSSEERLKLGKAIKHYFGPKFSMKKFHEQLNPDPAGKTKIEVGSGFLTNLIRNPQGGTVHFDFNIKDKATGQEITTAQRDFRKDENGSLIWHNGVFNRPSNEDLKKYSGMSKGLYAGVESFLKDVTADLPAAARDGCKIYMQAANSGFGNGYKGALLWAKHYFSFESSSDLSAWKGIYDRSLPDAARKLPELSEEINAALQKVGSKKQPYEFVKLGIPITKEQALKLVPRLDFDFEEIYRNKPTNDLGELLLIASGRGFYAVNFFNKTTGAAGELNEKRTAYYHGGRSSSPAAESKFRSQRVDNIVRQSWKPRGRSIVMTDARLREMSSWTREEVQEFHAKAPLTREAKQRVKEVLDRIGG